MIRGTVISGLIWSISSVSPVLANSPISFTQETVITLVDSPAPQGIQVTPDGTRVYTLGGSNKVSVIDTSDYSLLPSITLNQNAQESVITPDGRFLYVEDFALNKISVIDTDPQSPSYHTVVDVITSSTFNSVDKPAITPDGSKLFWTNQYDGVSVIDPSINQVVNTIVGQGNTDGAAVSPDGAKLYVVTSQPGIDIMDVATEQYVSSIALTGHQNGGIVKFTPDGSKAYVSNILAAPAGVIFVIDAINDNVSGVVGGFDLPARLDMTADGKYLIVPERPANRISILDTQTDTVVQTIDDVPGPAFAVLSPDNTHLYVSNQYNGNVTVYSTNRAMQVAIDIKPGSDPNCFNLNGQGVIPVAILGGADSDVNSINTDPNANNALSFNGLAVRVRGNKGPLCSIEYSNEDAFPDMVCHFEDDPQQWLSGVEGNATLTGELLDGTLIEGSDSICIVP